MGATNVLQRAMCEIFTASCFPLGIAWAQFPMTTGIQTEVLCVIWGPAFRAPICMKHARGVTKSSHLCTRYRPMLRAQIILEYEPSFLCAGPSTLGSSSWGWCSWGWSEFNCLFFSLFFVFLCFLSSGMRTNTATC